MYLHCLNPIRIKNRREFKTNSNPSYNTSFRKDIENHPLYWKIVPYIPDEKNPFTEVMSPSRAVYAPCGKCELCKAMKRQSWEIRSNEEARTSIYTSFITFTYSNKNLPWKGHLTNQDVSAFKKRLRRKIDYHYGIKSGAVSFLIIGEYAPETHRPHYHALVFFKKKLPNFSLESRRYICPFTKEPVFMNDYERLVADCWKKGAIRAEKPRSMDGTTKYVTKYITKGNPCPECPTIRISSSRYFGNDYITRTASYYLDDPSRLFTYFEPSGKTRPNPTYYVTRLRNLYPDVFGLKDDEYEYNKEKVDRLLLKLERTAQKIEKETGLSMENESAPLKYYYEILPNRYEAVYDKLLRAQKRVKIRAIEYGEKDIINSKTMYTKTKKIMEKIPSALRHPNSVNTMRLIDTDALDAKMDFAMDFCDGIVYIHTPSKKPHSRLVRLVDYSDDLRPYVKAILKEMKHHPYLDFYEVASRYFDNLTVKDKTAYVETQQTRLCEKAPF